MRDTTHTKQDNRFERLPLGSDGGQTTVEYAVVLSFVIAIAIVAFATLQPNVMSFFTTIASRLASVAAGA
jgi:Flp pilus assembly pilin Flp